VLDLLLARIEVGELVDTSKDYQPLPHVWHSGLHFRESERFVEVLRKVITWIAEKPGSWRRCYEGGDLFSAVAGQFDEQVLQVLIEAVESGDQARIRAVGITLRK